MVILILIIAFVVYAVFFKDDPQLDPLVSGKNSTPGLAVGADTKVIANEIFQSLTRIESLTLDRVIFTNPIFQSLNDRGEPILPEPIGRRNPFAPLGDTSVNFNSSIEPANDISETEDSTSEVDEEDSTEPVTSEPVIE